MLHVGTILIYGYYRVKDLHGKRGNAPSSYPIPVTAEEREEEQVAVPHEPLEMSLELQSFHQAVSQLDAAEEEIMEQHRTMIQVCITIGDSPYVMMQLSFIVFRRADSLC